MQSSCLILRLDITRCLNKGKKQLSLPGAQGLAYQVASKSSVQKGCSKICKNWWKYGAKNNESKLRFWLKKKIKTHWNYLSWRVGCWWWSNTSWKYCSKSKNRITCRAGERRDPPSTLDAVWTLPTTPLGWGPSCGLCFHSSRLSD